MRVSRTKFTRARAQCYFYYCCTLLVEIPCESVVLRFRARTVARDLLRKLSFLLYGRGETEGTRHSPFSILHPKGVCIFDIFVALNDVMH